jgi:hypothetical protein
MVTSRMSGWQKLGLLVLLMVLPACAQVQQLDGKEELTCVQHGVPSMSLVADNILFVDGAYVLRNEKVVGIYSPLHGELCVISPVIPPK